MLNKNNPSDFKESDSNIASIINSVESSFMNRNTHACPILDKKFTNSEILAGIKHLKNGKASGCDAISNEIIKVSAPFIINILCIIFNKLLELEHYPIQWSTGLIMPLPKSGDLTDPNNFKGITINSCLSKLFTLLMNFRLNQFCDMNATVHYNQLGFRKGFRTSDQVFTLKTIVDQAFAEGKKLYACFVDFKKAYDLVWRDGLFYKLLKCGISQKFVSLLRNMYSRLQTCVKLPGGLSNPFPSRVGLKQGCNLSPCLFNIFINDLVDELDKNNTNAPKLGGLDISCLLYADDLVIMSESEIGLQEALNTLEKFTKEWHMEINPTKTKCLTFSRGKKPTPPAMKVGQISLQNCSSYCYLGTVFSENGSLNLAASSLSAKARSAMFSLLKNLYTHKSCSVSILLDLFDKIVSPIATYNAEVWGVSCVPTNPNNNALLDQDYLYKLPIESLQCYFLKRVLGVNDKTSNWAVISETGRLPMVLKIFNSMLKFLLHMKASKSKILIAALNTNRELASNTWSASIKKVLAFCNLEWEDLSLYDINKSRRFLVEKFKSEWLVKKGRLQVSGKLDLYASIKVNFEQESYLKLTDFSSRNAISKMRISAHGLPIETGRYSGIPRNERVCPLCNNGIGNELHYLLECNMPKMVDVRVPILQKVVSNDSLFYSMSGDQKCKYLLSTDDTKQLNNTGKLCYKLQKVFKEEMKAIANGQTSADQSAPL